MAARTQVTMGVTWGVTLCVYSAGDGLSVLTGYPASLNSAVGCGQSVGVSALGASATLACLNVQAHGAAQTEAPEKPAGYPESAAWTGLYITYRLTISAPGFGNNDTTDYAVWVADGWQAGGASSGVEFVVGDLKVPVTFSVSGLYLKASVADASYATRTSPMDYTDRTGLYSWYADEYATVTAAGGGLSVAGTMTGALIGEVELGSNFWAIGAMTPNRAPNAAKDYMGLEDFSWAGSLVPGDACCLYSPGLGDEPWPEVDQGAGWLPSPPANGNAAHVYGAGGSLFWQRVGSSTSTLDNFDCLVCVPYLWTMHPVDAKFWFGGDPYTITYDGQLKEWVDGEAQHKTWTDETDWDEWLVSWLTAEQRSRYYSHTITVDENDDWREAEGEAVGGANAVNNDERTGLLMHPITASDLSTDPWWRNFSLMEIAHLTSLDVNDPEGVPSRPSLWTGGTGVTVDAGDNDAWSVAAGTANPQVSRTYKTRYWLRLNRLGDHADDEAEEHDTDWPLVLFPNEPTINAADDAAWITSVPYEDEWHWAEFAWLQVGLTAPVAGTVTLTVHYSTVVVDDPNTTCFEHRFGTEGTWEYTRTQRTARYTADVQAGANTVLIDLCRDADGNDIQGATCLLHVDSLTWALPANTTGSAQDWALTGFSLVQDQDAGVTTHIDDARPWRQWDWLGDRWVGWDAHHDGVPAMQIAPLHGYGSYPHSRGYMYIHKRQHCPDSELTDRLDYAEDISRLKGLIGWIRGWTVTYTDPVEADENTDTDQEHVAGTLYHWDIEPTVADHYTCGIMVGAITPPAGVRWHCYHVVYPQGKLTGLLYNSSGGRIRSAGSGVKVYDESPTALVGDYGTDEFGRWVSDPLLEDGQTYSAGTATGLTVGNREFSVVAGLSKLSQKQPDNAEGYLTDKHIAFADEGNGHIYLQTSKTAAEAFGAPRYVTDGTYPWVGVKPQGDIILCKQSGANSIVWMQSRDAGYTWAGVGTPVDGAYPVATEYNGVQYLVSYTSGVGQIIRRSQTYFSTLLTYGAATSALITSTTDAERAAFLRADSDACALCVVVPYSGALTVYRSVNDGETWTS